MKKVLGLDLGTNSIGWALVKEAESPGESSNIVKLGVRVIHFDTFASSDGGGSNDPVKDFCSGKGISPNAARTLKRSMRRNLWRYKLRRENLQKLLKEQGFIDESTLLREHGNASTFETYRLRERAVTEEVSLEEFARVLLMINKKRGYRSNRKADSFDEGHLVDGMDIAREMQNKQWTPGQWVQNHFKEGKRNVPDFYRSDLESEFNKIWNFQKGFYPEKLNEKLRRELAGANSKQTWAICKEPFQLKGISRTTKGFEQKKENYDWRVKALSQMMPLEELAIVFQELNSQINQSGGYLGAIGDRSKILEFNHWTVGEYLMAELRKNPNVSLKNRVFYRKDYQDEFERLWTTQAKFHPELTDELKKRICDNIIFYQRPLRSKKDLVSICELEKRKIETVKDGQKREMWIGPKVCPKSMPLFQEFKIWQVLNNVKIVDKGTGEERPFSQKEKEILFEHLNLVGKMTISETWKILGKSPANFIVNFKELEGNRTQEKLIDAYRRILEMNGFVEKDGSKGNIETIRDAFERMGVDTDFLSFDASLPSPDFERQKSFRLWHLLYSYEGDKSASGIESLVQKIRELCGFDEDAAKILSDVSFEEDYGNLSAKAMKKILPFMKDGERYDEACVSAGYRHSRKSLTKEALDKKLLRDKMGLLPKGSLRNPVVEKILNQMVNVVNAIIDTYGKPDEIRVELARELKKSASERQAVTDGINKLETEYKDIRKILKTEFAIENPSKNDLVRYRLTKNYPNADSRLFIPIGRLKRRTCSPRASTWSTSFLKRGDSTIPLQTRLWNSGMSTLKKEAGQLGILSGMNTERRKSKNTRIR